LDITPTVTKSQLYLIDYLEKHAFIKRQLAFSLVVPLALQMKYQKRIKVLNRNKLGDLSQLIPSDDIIMNDHMYAHLTTIKKAVELGYLSLEDDIKSKGKIQYEPFYKRIPNQARLTETRKAILDFIGNDTQSQSALLNQGFTKNSLNSMQKSGILSVEFKEKLKKSDLYFKTAYQPKTLTNAQNDAIDHIEKAIDHYQRFLLHGATASGKTEIYLSARTALSADKQLLILVPEIAQVYQLAASFSSVFDDVYMLHANLSLQERYDTWRQIQNGQAKIIIGTKHSIFQPFKSLGMIIIDEAHDANYVQDTQPRFNALDLSIELARYEHIPIVLSTATPTVEQYYDANMGKMTYLSLDEQVFKTKQKTILVDMKLELLNGNKDIFSNALKQAIEDLKPKEQAMILLNRRGYAPFVMCRECGYVPTCEVCHTSMVYHKKKDMLICHHCG
ncbi:MAG: primosomal protein N', partial [Tenericutes bacterium HGW-Tenericutes-8]